MRLLMKSLQQSEAIQKRQRGATEEETGVRAVVWAVVAFTFLGLVCVVAWKTDSFKALGELFGAAGQMTHVFHLMLITLGLIHFAGAGASRKS
jgi:hypothetical protein